MDPFKTVAHAYGYKQDIVLTVCRAGTTMLGVKGATKQITTMLFVETTQENIIITI